MDVIDYLDQDRVWMTGSGDKVRIAEMEPPWRRNSARWLANHAEALRVDYQLAEIHRAIRNHLLGPGEIRKIAHVEPELQEVLAEISKPDQWIIGRPLYRGLMAGLPALLPKVQVNVANPLR